MTINETPWHKKVRELAQHDSGINIQELDFCIPLSQEYLICDFCGFYPIQPENAHYRCPSCHQRTSCCEAV